MGAPLCRGESVRLYKRAQIFVGDVWGAFQVRLALACSPVLAAVTCDMVLVTPAKLQRSACCCRALHCHGQ